MHRLLRRSPGRIAVRATRALGVILICALVAGPALAEAEAPPVEAEPVEQEVVEEDLFEEEPIVEDEEEPFFEEEDELLDEEPLAEAEKGQGDAASFGRKTYDVLVLRPLQVTALIFGTALFIPAAIITSPAAIEPGGEVLIEEAWDYFVLVSYEDAFERPLGRF